MPQMDKKPLRQRIDTELSQQQLKKSCTRIEELSS
jgi:hypothetical protein